MPRTSKLMTLAIRFDELIGSGQVRNFAELAELGQVSRNRITQIMNLLLLAPDIQERLLFLPRVESGPDPIFLKNLQRAAKMAEWGGAGNVLASSKINDADGFKHGCNG